jgi:hypothetical protein
VLREILSSEKSYCASLQLLTSTWLHPLKSEPVRKTLAIDLADVRQLFSNLESIYLFHTNSFLPELANAVGKLDFEVLLGAWGGETEEAVVTADSAAPKIAAMSKEKVDQLLAEVAAVCVVHLFNPRPCRCLQSTKP